MLCRAIAGCEILTCFCRSSLSSHNSGANHRIFKYFSCTNEILNVPNLMTYNRVFLNALLNFCMVTTKMVGILTRRHILKGQLRTRESAETRTRWVSMRVTLLLRRLRLPKRTVMGTMHLLRHQLSHHQMTTKIPCTTTTSSMEDPSKTVPSKYFFFVNFFLLSDFTSMFSWC